MWCHFCGYVCSKYSAYVGFFQETNPSVCAVFQSALVPPQSAVANIEACANSFGCLSWAQSQCLSAATALHDALCCFRVRERQTVFLTALLQLCCACITTPGIKLGNCESSWPKTWAVLVECAVVKPLLKPQADTWLLALRHLWRSRGGLVCVLQGFCSFGRSVILSLVLVAEVAYNFLYLIEIPLQYWLRLQPDSNSVAAW